MAVTKDGRLFAWGGTLYGKRGQSSRGASQKYMPTEMDFFRENNLKVVQVACGENHSLAIAKRNKTKGKKQLYAWGDQKYFQCGQYS